MQIWDVPLGSVVDLSYSISPLTGRLTNRVRVIRRVGTTELEDGREVTELTVHVVGVDGDGNDLRCWKGHVTLRGEADVTRVTEPA